MGRGVKKILSAILVLTMVIGMSSFQVLAGDEKGGRTTKEKENNVQEEEVKKLSSKKMIKNTADMITRAEWIHDLNVLFEFSVDENNFPDNYFGDVQTDSPYYKDILLAVEFGVVDIEAGGNFRPEEPATREFAVQTLNFCLGFERETEGNYTFSDANVVNYPDAAQIAVDRGWTKLINEKFEPDLPVTSSETQIMFSDAKKVWKSTDIDTAYQNDFQFADDVIEIPEDIQLNVDENQKVTLYDCLIQINQGQSFAIYINGLPQVYKAQAVTKIGNTLIIETAEESQEAITNIDAQGVAEGDLSLAKPMEGATITYIAGGTEAKAFEDGQEFLTPYASGNIPLKAINLKKTINLSNGVSVGVNCKLSRLKVNYKINTGKQEAYIGLDGTAVVTCNGKFDGMEELGLPSSLTIGYIPIGGVGDIRVDIDFSTGGQIALTLTEGFSSGIQYDKSNGFRMVKTFVKKNFSIASEASIKAGVTVSVNATSIPFISGRVYASMGARASFESKTYADGKKPDTCMHLAAYLYVKMGGRITIDFGVLKKSFSQDIDVYTANNSPVRVAFHYEDNILVAACTRGWDVGYYTPWDSRYGSDGRGNGSSIGIDGSGKPYTIYTYEVDLEGNATITGYKGNVSALVIPDTIDGYTVRKIGDRAFIERNEIVTVVIPDTVIDLGAGAFKNSMNLTNVLLSNNLVQIHQYAFENCSSLEEIILPSSLEGLYEGAFQNCQQLRTVFIPATLQDTGYMGNKAYPGAFDKCTNLNQITFEEGILRIPNYLFWNCTGLSEILIPDSVTEIGSGAFNGCTNLKSVKLSSNLKQMRGYAFESCTSIKEISLPESLETLETGAFRNCTELEKIYIPAGLQDTGYMGNNAYPGAFDNCVKLNNVVFGEGILRIPSGLFVGCNGLREITIPDTVTEICWKSFADCTNLKKVNLPLYLKQLRSYAFEGCPKIEEAILPDGLERIEAGAFQNCGAIKKIYIPASLQDTGYMGNRAYPGAFNNCKSVEKIDFEDGIVKIPNALFLGCSGPMNVTLPDSVVEISWLSFKDCIGLKELKLSNSLTRLGDSAFSGCKKLESVKIPDATVNIEGNVFSNCTNLLSVTLPQTMISIPRGMFSGCTSLKGIQLPETITTIGESAFQNSGLENIEIPEKTTKICASAFANCDSLTDIMLNNGLKIIEQYTFSDSDALKKIVLPNTVENVGNYIFSECDELVDVTLSQSMPTVPSYAFYQCKKLENMVLPHSIVNIKENAFANCVKFKEITIPRTTSQIHSSAFSYPGNMTIFGVSGTYAEEYAKQKKIKFISKDVPATSVTLDKNEIRLPNGQSTALAANIAPSDFTDAVTWSTSDADIVTVDQKGQITAKSVGEAEVTLTAGKVRASCKIIVSQSVTSIQLDARTANIGVLDSRQLIATVSPSNATDQTVTWSSSDENIVSVDDKGLVTALKSGTAVIMATANDGSGISDSCNVTVRGNVYIVDNIDELESPHLYENDCEDIWVYTKENAESLSVIFDERTQVEDGYDYIRIYSKDGGEVGSYTGSQLAGQIISVQGDTIKIRLSSDGSETYWGFKVVENKGGKPEKPLPYFDVNENDWYYDSVGYVYNKGLMTGLNTTTFGPINNLARAHFAIILHRINGEPEISYTQKFPDVPNGEWFTKAILWASDIGVVNGYENTGLFGPGDNINREQMAVMMYRYAQYQKYDTSQKADFSKFQDASSVNEFAREAMQWAVGSGIITGKYNETRLDPQGNANRAECATIIMRFMEKYK